VGCVRGHRRGTRDVGGEGDQARGSGREGKNANPEAQSAGAGFPGTHERALCRAFRSPCRPRGREGTAPEPGPYYVSEYTPGERLVLERNRFYRGQRPHHVDRIEVDLAGEPSAVDDVANGTLDSVAATPDLSQQLAGLVRRYGINKSRLFVSPDVLTQMFVMNTRRPLLRDVRLRHALNFAVDRRAVVREFGQYAATTTDQYLPRVMPGFRDQRIYPLKGADPRKARALARGHTSSRVAVLYTCSERLDCIGAAQVLQRNLKAIGLELRIKRFPLQLMFQKLATPGEPFDLAWVGFAALSNDAQEILGVFDGRTIGQPDSENWSYFNEPKYNRLLERAGRLSGTQRYRAYGDLDVQLVRDAAPAIAVFNRNTWAFVSARTGCVVMNPSLDLTAICLK
jgi:peptide/nickel transport system substrate-binding protein